MPYSCLLFGMYNAYAKIGLLVLTYHVCSLCLVAIDLSDWPTYELLQVLHLSLYIPSEFLLVLTILSVSCWYIVFVARRTIFKLVYLRRLAIFRISKLNKEFYPFFGLLCSCGREVFSCSLAVSFFFRLWMICNGNPLFWAIALWSSILVVYLILWLVVLTFCLCKN